MNGRQPKIDGRFSLHTYLHTLSQTTLHTSLDYTRVIIVINYERRNMMQTENAPNNAKEGPGKPARLPQLKLMELVQDEEGPQMAVFALDDNLRPLATAKVDAEGYFELPDEVLEQAARFAVGPDELEYAQIERRILAMYRPEQFLDRDRLDFAKARWSRWLYYFHCVSGLVSHCEYWWSWPFLLRSQVAVQEPGIRLAGSAAAEALSVAETIGPSPHLDIFPWRCHVICDGVVEIYQRTCCFEPWVIFDPRLDDLIVRLKDLVVKLPPIQWPPPPPPPYRELAFYNGGALDERTVYARRDLAALQSLGPVEQAAYVQARPYLWGWWDCGSASKVAETTIQPDGTFSGCWLSFPYLSRCRREYAYVVKQEIGGVWTTIYDGLAAGVWYAADAEPNLISYHPEARDCGNDYPGEGAFAMLEMIGATEAWNLKTPAASGWDRVNTPGFNDGLLFPAPNPAAAVGQMLNCNMGGTLALRYAFSHELRDANPAGPVGPPRYYRVSICAADTNGDPTGSRIYYSDGLSWNRDDTGSTVSETLGPFPVGGENNLYKIPYLQDADWLGTQFHAYLDTAATKPDGSLKFPEGCYLITLELFDGAGAQLKPAGVPGPGTAAPFTFQRWEAELGSRPVVPFAALTHLFWWDNRPAYAEIVDLRVNHVPNTGQCQFLVSTDNAMFSAGYRAYHPYEVPPAPVTIPSFQLSHSLSWQRGIGGPSGYLEYENPNNVGMLPGLSGESNAISFGDLLIGLPPSEQKCSIALKLSTVVKTHNGYGQLGGLNRYDIGAFAVEIS